MPRYGIKPSIKPRAEEDDDYWEELNQVNMITVCDHQSVFTGLLDLRGEKIYRFPDPIGFRFD